MPGRTGPTRILALPAASPGAEPPPPAPPASPAPPAPGAYGYPPAGYQPPPYGGPAPAAPYGYPPAGYGPAGGGPEGVHRPQPPLSPAGAGRGPGGTYGTDPGFGAPASYGPPAGPAALPDPPPARGRRRTVALVTVALVVAIGAGGLAYAFLGGDDTKDAKASGASAPAGQAPADDSPTTSPPPSPSPTPSDTKGVVPDTYLGTWTGGLNTGSGFSSRRLVIRQGTVGDTVLSVTADGPPGAGAYHCVFEAALKAPPRPGGPVLIGPSKVTVGKPMSSCTPGTPTELKILGDGKLRRTTTNGESLTYTKGGR